MATHPHSHDPSQHPDGTPAVQSVAVLIFSTIVMAIVAFFVWIAETAWRFIQYVIS